MILSLQVLKDKLLPPESQYGSHCPAVRAVEGDRDLLGKDSLSHAGQDKAGHPLAKAGLQLDHLDVGGSCSVLKDCQEQLAYALIRVALSTLEHLSLRSQPL